ncbi:MAG: hypothetical protein R2813_10910 [Flavobacteriales bacterium]
MINNKSWFKLSLFYFILVALVGVLLRSYPFFDEIPFEFRNLIHSHSHVAMLGWVFNVLLLGITREFLSNTWIQTRFFRWLFWGIQVSIIGMLISFALQGYAVWSIVFSTAHILFSYAMITRIVIDIKLWQSMQSVSRKLLLGSLAFLFLSSLGPWGLAILAANGMAGTPLYKSAIYWFLHFTYNGWMTLALLAIWLKVTKIKSPKAELGLTLLLTSIPLSFILSLYEFELHMLWHIAGIAIGVVQFLGICWVISSWLKRQRFFSSSFLDMLFKFSLVMLLLKSLLQIISAVPSVNTLAFFNRDVVILYMHLVFIGWISIACILYGYYLLDLGSNSSARISTILFLLGFIIQEVELVIHSLGIGKEFPLSHESILLLSATLMLTGTVGIFMSLWSSKNVPRIRSIQGD